MTLVPLLDCSCQHFGLDWSPEEPPTVLNLQSPAGYLRTWKAKFSKADSGSTVSCDKREFEVNLDVQQFKPEEITAKVYGENTVTIEGKHEEKQDEHGFISRHFMRKYVLSKDCDINQIRCRLYSDGILMITAPIIENKHKTIPIRLTGDPVKKIDQKKSENEQ